MKQTWRTGRKSKKKKTSGIKPKSHPIPSGVYTPPAESWEVVKQMAKSGELNEAQRAVIAKKATMIKALQVFEDDFNNNLNEYNTNLGILLGTSTTIAGSLVVFKSGSEGENEYIPLLFTIHIPNKIQNLDEHVKYLKGEWHKEVK